MIDTGTTNNLYTFNISRDGVIFNLLMLAEEGTMTIDLDKDSILRITKEKKLNKDGIDKE